MQPLQNALRPFAGLFVPIALSCLILAGPAGAGDLGFYQVVNSAGMIKENAGVSTMGTDMDSAQVQFSLAKEDKELTLNINGSSIVLFKLDKGLAALDWSFDGAPLLQREDVLALSGAGTLTEVDTWGASLDWPNLGKATMVLFRVNDVSFAGFLISTPGEKTVVRQMEFHPVSGPRKRRRG